MWLQSHLQFSTWSASNSGTTESEATSLLAWESRLWSLTGGSLLAVDEWSFSSGSLTGSSLLAWESRL
jgi:hypothetical protein